MLTRPIFAENLQHFVHFGPFFPFHPKYRHAQTRKKSARRGLTSAQKSCKIDHNCSAGAPPAEKGGHVMQTPWADTLDRAQPLPEYPRPQMVRDSYLNLNGPWSYAPGDQLHWY